MLEVLTGFGLAGSAGLNAWIPLLVVGLLARYTDLLTLPSGWEWLGDGWALALFTVLLAVELVADKIPMVDSVNDAVQTAIRPTSGGLVFGAGSSAETLTVQDPGGLFGDRGWVPIAVGVVVALVVHAIKAAVRPVLNAMTGCVAAPVVSTIEDATSVLMSLVAILLPVLVIGFLVGIGWVGWWGLRRRRARRRRRAGLTAAGSRPRRSRVSPRS